jgi:hypothetical protein
VPVVTGAVAASDRAAAEGVVVWIGAGCDAGGAG